MLGIINCNIPKRIKGNDLLRKNRDGFLKNREKLKKMIFNGETLSILFK
tara:strand:+ start:325 stop:471 length:147 start_codon:yes stop_codon:yes gene_type:complete